MSKIIIGREYPDVLINLVKNSKQSIKILIYDWRWYGSEITARIQQFNNEILQASRRGVEITVLLNDDTILSIFKNTKISIKKVNTKKTMHIKMIIIDDKYLLLGSHNLTKNAFELNHELSILIEDQEAINRCNVFFQNICHL